MKQFIYDYFKNMSSAVVLYFVLWDVWPTVYHLHDINEFNDTILLKLQIKIYK